MNKGLTAIGVALLLLGAGCGGGGAATSSISSTKEAEVQAAVNALVAAGEVALAATDEAVGEAAVQALVSVPINDGITIFGISGYFSEASKDIDWSASTWSNNNKTVALQSTDGITLGTWNQDAAGVWKASSAFWFE